MMLSNEMIIYMLSYCDYQSVTNAMRINDVLNQCGSYLLTNMEYWKNLCVKEIPPYDLKSCLSNEPTSHEMYKWVFLKWLNWKHLSFCVTCTPEINFFGRNLCPVHEITARHSRILFGKFEPRGIFASRGQSRNVEHKDDKFKVVVATNRVSQSLYVCNLSLEIFMFVARVETILPALISCTFYDCGIFAVGLRNGMVFMYNVESWSSFNLATYDMLITGIGKQIVSISIQENASERSFLFSTTRRFYTISWNFRNQS